MNNPSYEEVLSRKSTRGWIRKNYPEFYEHLLCMKDCSIWGERVYKFYHNIEETPICPICGKKLTFLDPKKGYRKYCSPKCAHKDPSYHESIRETVMKKYRVTNVFQNKDVQNSYKRTMMDKYGSKNPMQIEEFKRKSRNTNVILRGVENPGILKTKDVVDFNKIDNKYKYKCPHPGCEKCSSGYYLCSKNIHNNRKETHTELCTVLLPEKFHNNNSTYPELFIRNILEMHHIFFICNSKSIINPLELDIYIPDKKIAIECNGIYWHSSDKVNKEYHFNKYIRCQQQGISLLTIWEDWIINYPDIVEDIILRNLVEYEDILANNLSVRDINEEELIQFEKNNSLFISQSPNISLGLFSGGNLISTMSFSNKKENEWEILQESNKVGVCIKDSRLQMIDHFIKTIKPSNLEITVLNDICVLKEYVKIGFIESETYIGGWEVNNNSTNRKVWSDSFSNINPKTFHIFDSGQTKLTMNKELL